MGNPNWFLMQFCMPIHGLHFLVSVHVHVPFSNTTYSGVLGFFNRIMYACTPFTTLLRIVRNVIITTSCVYVCMLLGINPRIRNIDIAMKVLVSVLYSYVTTLIIVLHASLHT